MDVFESPRKAVLYSSSFNESVLVAMNKFENDLLEAVSQELCDGSNLVE